MKLGKGFGICYVGKINISKNILWNIGIYTVYMEMNGTQISSSGNVWYCTQTKSD